MVRQAHHEMRLILLGSGTSQGVPAIGCDCRVCKSENLKDKRLRPSALIQVNGLNILIDTATDFREQMLRHDIRRLDTVLFTHAHFDHIAGLDDIRQFNFLQKSAIDCYASEETMGEIKKSFRYIFGETVQQGGGIPQINPCIIAEDQFDVKGVEVQAVEAYHGKMKVLGFRIDKIAYVTDTNHIPELSIEKLTGVKVLILNALRRRKHSTHYSLDESIAVAQCVGARQTYFTHICHDLLHDEVNAELPSGMELGYDGLVVEV